MFGTMKTGAAAYSKVRIETGVMTASPHQLILMLFEGAVQSLRNAGMQIKNGDVAGKGASISKAIDIIDNGLRASLDKRAGGEIAANLDALYEYMSRRLLEANLKNAPGIIDEVLKLLAELKSAWEAIGDTAARPQPEVTHQAHAPAQGPAASFDNLAPRRASLVSAG